MMNRVLAQGLAEVKGKRGYPDGKEGMRKTIGTIQIRKYLLHVGVELRLKLRRHLGRLVRVRPIPLAPPPRVVYLHQPDPPRRDEGPCDGVSVAAEQPLGPEHSRRHVPAAGAAHERVVLAVLPERGPQPIKLVGSPLEPEDVDDPAREQLQGVLRKAGVGALVRPEELGEGLLEEHRPDLLLPGLLLRVLLGCGEEGRPLPVLLRAREAVVDGDGDPLAHDVELDAVEAHVGAVLHDEVVDEHVVDRRGARGQRGDEICAAEGLAFSWSHLPGVRCGTCLGRKFGRLGANR